MFEISILNIMLGLQFFSIDLFFFRRDLFLIYSFADLCIFVAFCSLLKFATFRYTLILLVVLRYNQLIPHRINKVFLIFLLVFLFHFFRICYIHFVLCLINMLFVFVINLCLLLILLIFSFFHPYFILQ